MSMPGQQDPPPSERWLENIADRRKKRGQSAQEERSRRQDDIKKVATGVLPLPVDHDSPSLQRASKSVVTRPILDLDSGTTAADTIRRGCLPTPPTSPVDSRVPTETASVKPLARKVGSDELAQLQISLADHQSKIRLLNLELEDAQNEIGRLREERRKASKDHICAVREDNEDEIEKCKKREERLLKMIDERDLSIEKLEESIREGWKRDRDLRRMLAEAEAQRRAVMKCT